MVCCSQSLALVALSIAGAMASFWTGLRYADDVWSYFSVAYTRFEKPYYDRNYNWCGARDSARADFRLVF